jgi:hypothetical protein
MTVAIPVNNKTFNNRYGDKLLKMNKNEIEKGNFLGDKDNTSPFMRKAIVRPISRKPSLRKRRSIWGSHRQGGKNYRSSP